MAAAEYRRADDSGASAVAVFDRTPPNSTVRRLPVPPQSGKPVGLAAIVAQPDVLPAHKEIALIALARGMRQDQLAKYYNAAEPDNPKRFTGATVHEQLARTKTGISRSSRRRYATVLGLEPDHLDLVDLARPLSRAQLRSWRVKLGNACRDRAARFDGTPILARFDRLDSSAQEQLLRAYAVGVRRSNLALPYDINEIGTDARSLPAGIAPMLALAKRLGHDLLLPLPRRLRPELPPEFIARGLAEFLDESRVEAVIAFIDRLVRERAGAADGPPDRERRSGARGGPANRSDSASETIVTDGRWWDALSARARTAAMLAGTSAFESGFLAGLDAALTGIEKKLALAEPLSAEQKTRLVGVAASVFSTTDRPSFSAQVINAYADGVTAFYERYPEAAGVEFGDVLKCVADAPTESAAELAAWYTKYRKSDPAK